MKKKCNKKYIRYVEKRNCNVFFGYIESIVCLLICLDILIEKIIVWISLIKNCFKFEYVGAVYIPDKLAHEAFYQVTPMLKYYRDL